MYLNICLIVLSNDIVEIGHEPSYSNVTLKIALQV